MAPSVLGNITLGYRPLWNAARNLAAVQLFIERQADASIDAEQLVRTLQEYGKPHAPPLLLSVKSPALLRDLLDHAPAPANTFITNSRATPYWIEVRSEWMGSHAMPQRVQRAHQRGLRLVWRAESDHPPSSELAVCFFTRLLRLSPQAALAALQAAARIRASAPGGPTPVQPGMLYEGIASRLLMEHCLDQQQATALLGWPEEDILRGLQHQAAAPDIRVMQQLVQALDTDWPVEKIEALLGQDPILTFQFLAHANSAAVGLGQPVESLHHGLVLLGSAEIKRWLIELLPQASHDSNLRPVKAAMVLRAKLMENLMTPGAEQPQAREIYLCGLFSQMDVLMGEPLGSALHRVPLNSRIYNATVRNSGPYAPLLQIAGALETDNGIAIRALSQARGMGLEEINQALLKSLAGEKF